MSRRRPYWREPDDPTPAEVVGALVLAAVLIVTLWTCSVLFGQ